MHKANDFDHCSESTVKKCNEPDAKAIAIALLYFISHAIRKCPWPLVGEHSKESAHVVLTALDAGEVIDPRHFDLRMAELSWT